MPARAKACIESLTEDEQASLRDICTCGCDRKIPDAHAVKLLGLGLAELNFGEIRPTSSARSAVCKMDAQPI